MCALLLPAVVVASGCSGSTVGSATQAPSSPADTSADRTAADRTATDQTAAEPPTDFGTAESFAESTLPTADSQPPPADGGPILTVSGPTLDAYYPNFPAVFGTNEAYRCLWFVNSSPLPVRVDSVVLVDQQPSRRFEFGAAAPPPVCRDYLTENFAPVDVLGAHYGGCDGVNLPAADLTDGNAHRAACVIRIDVIDPAQAAGTDWTANLRFTLTGSCTDLSIEPCLTLAGSIPTDSLPTQSLPTGPIPTGADPIEFQWQNSVPVAACRKTLSAQPNCLAAG